MNRDSTGKGRLRFSFNIVLVGIFSLAGIFFLMLFVSRYLTSSNYFIIKHCDYLGPLNKSIQKSESNHATELIGQNIFKVDLQKTAERLCRMYSNYKSISLGRMLPDRILINLKPRQAVARVELSEYFYVDGEGVLFRLIEQDDSLQLPLIIGLKNRIPNPQSGAKYNESSLQAILKFINSLNKTEVLAERLKIAKINLANVNDVFLFTITDCKINLGTIDSLSKDLSILQRLIGEIDTDLDKIEYIDLRFREPAVKYKKK
jgi:cell division septal protein FtsQ